MSVTRRLTQTETMVYSYVGCARNAQCLCGNWRSNAPAQNSWSFHIEGAGGEMATAKVLGVYWEPIVGDCSASDVLSYQVRTNISRKHTDMIIRPRDYQKGADNKIFISVLSFAPTFVIQGWILGRHARQKQWLRRGSPDRPECWWVPANALNPWETLPPPSCQEGQTGLIFADLGARYPSDQV
jgi:hypothetical protein